MDVWTHKTQTNLAQTIRRASIPYWTALALLCGCTSASTVTPDAPLPPELTGGPNVCVGLRGNGFRVAAHFGALARITEEHGIPDLMTGGSSGTVSMFMADSIAMSPWLEKSGADPKLGASLLLKSIPRFLAQLEYEPDVQTAKRIFMNPESAQEARDVMSALGRMKGLSKIFYLGWKYATSSDVRALARLRNSVYLKEAIEPEFSAYGAETARLSKLAQDERDPGARARLLEVVEFRKGQAALSQALSVPFSRRDVNVNFRPGVMSFGGIARIVDRAASFYAGYNFFSPGLEDALATWTARCAPLSARRTFEELAQVDPSCGTEFDRLARGYYESYAKMLKSKMPRCMDRPELPTDRCKRFRYEDPIGTKLESFASVATATGESAASYESLLGEYQTTTDPEFGRRFAIAPKDFKFGMYGATETIRLVSERFSRPFSDASGRALDFTQDFKAQRLHALGRVTWLEAITSSAAEPGNAKFRRGQDADGQLVQTFGGWIDMNPGFFLKGMGCKTSIIVISESKPGEYFAERLIRMVAPGFTGFDMPDQHVAYGSGDATSDWGRWRNPANPASSETYSALASDAIYCSLWGTEDHIHFDGRAAGFGQDGAVAAILNMITRVGYHAQIHIPSAVSQTHPVRDWDILQLTRSDLATPSPVDPKRPRYLGCIPPG